MARGISKRTLATLVAQVTILLIANRYEAVSKTTPSAISALTTLNYLSGVILLHCTNSTECNSITILIKNNNHRLDTSLYSYL